jgi:glycosyltransferase involved in cell wall biosynthesis
LKIALVENFGPDFLSARIRYSKFLENKGFDVWAVVPDVDGVIPEIENQGIKVHPIALNVRERGLKNLVSYWFMLYRLFKKEQFNVVHLYRMQPNFIGTSAAFLANRKTKIINHITGIGVAFTIDNFKYYFLRAVIRVVYYINSHWLGAVLIYQNYGNREQIGVFKNSTVVKGSSVNESIFLTNTHANAQELRSSLALANYPSLLFVSRLLKQKGLSSLVEGLNLFNSFGENKFNLIIVGWPDVNNPDSYTESEIEILAANEYIHYLGRRQDIDKLLDIVEIGALPSCYPEGTPRFLLETVAKGKAVLTTRMEGCDHLVNEGENGFLVKPHSVNDVVEVLKRFSKENLALMGEKSKTHYLNEFSEKIVFNGLLNAYGIK